MTQIRLAKASQFAHFSLRMKFEPNAADKEDLRTFEGDRFESIIQRYLEIGSKLRILDQREVRFQIRESEHVIFEGAQGVLLDEWYGFHPHTTWSTTTMKNADALIAQSGRMNVRSIGVVRAYATRHGQGPFPTENAALTKTLRETTNSDTGAQGGFRVGWFDVPLTRYALEVYPSVQELAVTCLDRLAEVPEWSVCESYKVPAGSQDRFYMSEGRAVGLRSRPPEDLPYQMQLGADLSLCEPVLCHVPGDVGGYAKAIEERLGLPVNVLSTGPTAEDKIWRE